MPQTLLPNYQKFCPINYYKIFEVGKIQSIFYFFDGGGGGGFVCPGKLLFPGSGLGGGVGRGGGVGLGVGFSLVMII